MVLYVYALKAVSNKYKLTSLKQSIKLILILLLFLTTGFNADAQELSYASIKNRNGAIIQESILEKFEYKELCGGGNCRDCFDYLSLSKREIKDKSKGDKLIFYLILAGDNQNLDIDKGIILYEDEVVKLYKDVVKGNVKADNEYKYTTHDPKGFSISIQNSEFTFKINREGFRKGFGCTYSLDLFNEIISTLNSL